MGELTAIGFTSGQSLFHRLDPRTKQLLVMGLSVASLRGQVVFLTLLSFILFFGFRAARVRFVRLAREIRFFLFFLIALFAFRTISFDGWMPVINHVHASHALMVCWRLLLVVLMGVLLMTTTRTAHIRGALIWLLKPIPFIDENMAATMAGLVVRLLPQILYQAAEVSDAQRARCIDQRKTPLIRLNHFGIALLRRVFQGADELAAAMQARCYNENRTPPDLTFSHIDGLAALAAGLIVLTLFFP